MSPARYFVLVALALTADGVAFAQPADPPALVEQYCVRCHNARLKTAGLVLEGQRPDARDADIALWEKVLKKLHAGSMPPAGLPRPEREAMERAIAALEGMLDQRARVSPNPGRPPIHRLNRLEYTNAVRDLLGLQIDGRELLPADDSGFGFDNIADVLTVSPGLLERYLLAAHKISRLALGDATIRPVVTTYTLPPVTLGQQERMSEEHPFGSRGGTAIRHYFPLDGEYSVKFALQRSDLAEGNVIRGLAVANQIDLRVDGQRQRRFTIGGPGTQTVERGYFDQDYSPEAGLEARFFVAAGEHVLTVSFDEDVWEMEGVGTERWPLTSEIYNRGRNTGAWFGKIEMGLARVDIAGPFDGRTPGNSASRRRVFVCQPATTADEEACARRILSQFARRAYRHRVTPEEIAKLLDAYRVGRRGDSFEEGIRTAIARTLVDIRFLFRLEQDPDGAAPGAVYTLGDFDLASRLSFFLWSSIPDDELLSLAEAGKLRDAATLDRQVQRMLADPRSAAFTESFFGQWLAIRNVASARPDSKIFPEFDENLRQAFQEETRRFLESQVREDRPAFDLLTADYTFVNERLARHYGIPNVLGSHFRRVKLTNDARRGLLGQGSLLMVTSYNDRTSVVQRGKWILDHVFGTPPPPPPPDVPPLDSTPVAGTLRQRMEQHRRNPVCASCHNTIDPLGFALENFDAIGKYRTAEGRAPIDASGVMIDGTKFTGPVEFRNAVALRERAFIGTLSENLLTYAIGRGVEPFDMPAVRQILREAKLADYRWSGLILSIVRSAPFQMRRAES